MKRIRLVVAISCLSAFDLGAQTSCTLTAKPSVRRTAVLEDVRTFDVLAVAESGSSSTTIGVRWRAGRLIRGGWKGEVLPRALYADLHTSGTLTTHAKSNSEPFNLGLDGGTILSIYKPRCNDVVFDPDSAPASSLHLGHARLAVRTLLESGQRDGNTNFDLGPVLRYNSGRTGVLWSLVPSVEVVPLFVHPLKITPGDTTTTGHDHLRFEVSETWTVPVHGRRFILAGDLHYWRLGQAASYELREAWFGTATVTWMFPFEAGPFKGFFVRWASGAQPLSKKGPKPWNLGITVAK